MASFRCYFLDDKDHIRAAQVIDAKALGEAIEKGLALLRESPHQALEIWEGATKVFPVSQNGADGTAPLRCSLSFGIKVLRPLPELLPYVVPHSDKG